jgi:glucose-6-phosphate isomerase
MISLSGPLLTKYNPHSKIARDFNSITKRLAEKDPSLWGESATAEAATRLNWVTLPTTSQKMIPQIAELKDWVAANNLSQVILCGMGGSSLAPEIFGKCFQKEIMVLDSTDPEQIAMALNSNLKETLVIIGSKSGNTIETISHKNLLIENFKKLGLEPRNHILIITDPESPLDNEAKENGYKVINADPYVGGRFSALTAFGLVPAALLGIDVTEVLAQAAQAEREFLNEDSSVVKVATLLLEASNQFISFTDNDSNVPGLSDWIEQLVAESTGKNEIGRLPIVSKSISANLPVTTPLITFKKGIGDMAVVGSLAEHFIFWEWVTALLGRGLGVDPFNQPNVAEAKERTGKLLDIWNGEIQTPAPSYEDELLSIYWSTSLNSIESALGEFFSDRSGYVALMAYLNRKSDLAALELRELIENKIKAPTTFGWGPRFLHSTGQIHKGGQKNGRFLQITADSKVDFMIPQKGYGFQTLIMAQALGDGQALAQRNYPLIRFHLKDRRNGIAKIAEAIRKF